MKTLDEALEIAIGGSYELPDGRSFWLDRVAVREIMGRVGPVIEAECERRSQQPTNGVAVEKCPTCDGKGLMLHPYTGEPTECSECKGNTVVVAAPANGVAVPDELREARAKIERLEASIKSACRWFWPEDNTSSDACADDPSDIYRDGKPGEIFAISSGGVFDTRYYAYLPAADDSDSDDEFEIDEATEDQARIAIGKELERRSLLPPQEGDRG